MIARVRMWAKLTLFVLFAAPLVPLQWIAVRFDLGMSHRLPVLFHRAALRALGVRVTVAGRPSAERPLLLVANHVSWLDIVVLGSLMPVSFVAKSEVAGWPLFGTLARLQRSVFVERAQRRKTGEQAQEIAARLADGDAIVLFAEGTTGDGTTLLPFRSSLLGAARAAVDAGGHAHVLVQPVAIAHTRIHGLPAGVEQRAAYSWVGDTDLVPHLLMVARDGALDVTVFFAEPVAFDRDGDRKAVTLAAEREVRRMFTGAITGRG